MKGQGLVSGGAGYIVSQTTLALLQAGHNVVMLDNLCNSSGESLTLVLTLERYPINPYSTVNCGSRVSTVPCVDHVVSPSPIGVQASRCKPNLRQ